MTNDIFVTLSQLLTKEQLGACFAARSVLCCKGENS
jgi:hypothetical protein